MNNKSTLVFITLCAIVPIIFIAVAFFGPEKEIAISLKGPNTFGLDDEKITKKYDYLEKKEKEKREKFKKEVEKIWDSYKESTSKTYVSYSNDLTSRSIVDFEKGEVTIEVIVDENESKDGTYNLDLNPDQNIYTTQIGNVKNIILSINASLINTITFFALQDKEDDSNQEGSRSGKGLNSKFFRQLPMRFPEGY